MALTSHNKPTRQDRRLLLFGIGAAAIVLVGGYIGSLHRLPPDPTPAQNFPVPNGYDTLQAAYKLYVPMPSPAIDEVEEERPDIVVNGHVVPRHYSPAKREAWLKRNAAALTLLRVCLTQKYLPPKDYFHLYSKQRELARLLFVEAHAQILRNDWLGAIDTGLNIIALGYEVMNGGATVGRLVGDAIQDLGLQVCSDAMPQLDVSQCKHAIFRLEAIQTRRVSLHQSFEEEKANALQITFVIFHAPPWQAAQFAYDGNASWAALRWKFANFTTIVNDEAEFWDKVTAEADKPYKLRARIKIPRNSLSDPLIDTFIHRDHYSFLNARYETDISFLLTALALHAFHLEHGGCPTSLTQLVPGILKTVPLDPFGAGGPLLYRRQGAGYLLYSVGPDGRDDGGRPIDHPANKFNRHLVFYDDKGDMVAGVNR